MNVILTNARIIDGLGNELCDSYLCIEDSKIKEIGQMSKPSSGNPGSTIDLEGATIMPGIIDCHVHLGIEGGINPMPQISADTDCVSVLRMRRNAQKTLKAGVTTVRDEGGKNHVEFSLRQAVGAGLCLSPRLILSGRIICMTGGHGWHIAREANGVDDVRKAAREQIKAGADSVKFIATGGIVTEGVEISSPQLSVEEIRAGVEEAKKAGKITSAHAQGSTGIKNAVKAGIHSVEHAYFLDDEGIELMLKNGTFLVPTSAAVKLVVEKGTAAGIPAWAVRKAESALDSHIESFKKAWKAGVKMAMGTDTGMPYVFHGDNLQELEAMVDLGLSPMEAIIMSTKNGADLLRLQDVTGIVQKGKEADLLIVKGNPLKNIGLLREKQNILYVFKGGELVQSI